MHKFLFYNKFIAFLYSTIIEEYNLASWWWAQQYSKHVEEYKKLIIKQEFVH